MYTTRFRREAKRLQLERQVVIEISDAGRIHRQVLDRLCFSVAFSGRKREKPTRGSSVGKEKQDDPVSFVILMEA